MKFSKEFLYKFILVLLVLSIFMSLILITEQYKTNKILIEHIQDLVDINKKQTDEIKELWENINAINIDYNQLYQEIYKESR